MATSSALDVPIMVLNRPKQIANDRLSSRGYAALLRAAFGRWECRALYCFTDWRMWTYLFDVVESSGYGVRSMIVWDKGTPGMGRGWRSQHEIVMHAAKEVLPWDKYASALGNVITCPRTGNEHHTTEKPVQLLEVILENSPWAQVVCDPFAGSGSTLIACEAQGKAFRGLELDPAYVDVCVQRWEQYTGRKAERLTSEVAPDTEVA